MESLNKLKQLVASIEASGDAEKFNGGGKGFAQAGGRIRKVLQEIKVIAQAARVEVQDTIKTRKATAVKA